MTRKIMQVLLLMMVGLVVSPALAAPAKKSPAETFIVYYTNLLPAEKFKDYSIIAFDSDHHPPLDPLLYQNKQLLGYISFGEAEDYRSFFKDLEAQGLLLDANKDWPGHHIIDIRKPEWAKYVIEELIPPLLHAGFTGIMVDTLDSPLALEAKDPKKYAGMKEAAANLIKAVRYHYPDMTIMVNRGFEVLPQIAGDINYLLAESIRVNYDVKTKKFSYFPDSVYDYHVNLFKEMMKQAPGLQIVTLDYWDMKDAKGVKALYARQRAHGFIPYVAALELQDVYPEPR